MPFYQPGTIAAASVGLAFHLGIATEHGTIVANSKRKRCVSEETLEEFSGGRPIRAVGYWGSLSPAEVIRRARSLIGKPYNLIGFNCEHVVRWAHGLKPRSNQVEGALMLGLAIAVAALLARR